MRVAGHAESLARESSGHYVKFTSGETFGYCGVKPAFILIECDVSKDKRVIEIALVCVSGLFEEIKAADSLDA